MLHTATHNGQRSHTRLRSATPLHKAWTCISSLLFVVFFILSVSSASARTVGGTRSKMSRPPLFGFRHPNQHNYQSRASEERILPLGDATAWLQLRGGSSLGGGGRGTPKYRPTPSQDTNPFRKSRESTSPRFRTTDPEQDTEDDVENAKEVIDSFLTRDSRSSFIARVYGILSIQLGFTALIIMLFGTYAPLTNIFNPRSITATASPLLFMPLAGVIISTIAFFRVAVSPKARQQSPNKWWWLAIFTLGESLFIGPISSLYTIRSVITAMGATALASVTVSMYTIMQQNPKYDLSQWGATLSSWTTILIVYGLIGIAQSTGWLPAGFLPYSDLLYSLFATFLFTLYLAYHTKLVVGGKHAKYRMNEKDYVFGAMAIYADIVRIFLHLLEILGTQRD